MRLGKHYVEPMLGIGILIGLILGLAVMNARFGMIFLVAISAWVGYAIGNYTKRQRNP